jgi:hypothetical protein
VFGLGSELTPSKLAFLYVFATKFKEVPGRRPNSGRRPGIGV